VRPGGERVTVLVVGAGVSGCACGATVASALGRRGVRVVLMNSALDSVCLPSLGPELCAGEDAWERVADCLYRLPAPLRDAWLDACLVAEEVEQVVSVDRRVVSVEGKRALECIEGLHFRQGLVVDLGVRSAPAPATKDGAAWTFWVETAFGEVLEAEIVVLAPGLSLGGQAQLGCTTLVGGRYGETPSSGLREALERLGAEWREVEVDVGPRFDGKTIPAAANEPDGPKDEEPWLSRGSGWTAGMARPRSMPLRTVRARGLPRREDQGLFPPQMDIGGAAGDSARSEAERHEAEGWPAGYPPCPQWSHGVTGQSFWVVRQSWPAWGNADGGRGASEADETSRSNDAGLSSGAGSSSGASALSDGNQANDVAGVKKSANANWKADDGGSGKTHVIACPDGVATNEIYIPRQEVAEAWLQGGGTASRLAQRVSGLAMANLDPRGRMRLSVEGRGLDAGRADCPVVWLAGRAAGARDYLESLASGVDVAEQVIATLLDATTEGTRCDGSARGNEGRQSR